MNENLKAARINFQAAVLQADIAGMQAQNNQYQEYQPNARRHFEEAAADHLKIIEKILQEKSDDGPFVAGIDPIPVDSCMPIRIWQNHVKAWTDSIAACLSDGDIWRCQPPAPTELLG